MSNATVSPSEFVFGALSSWLFWAKLVQMCVRVCVLIIRSLYSNQICCYHPPCMSSFKLLTIDSGAFPVATAKIWNALPDNECSSCSQQPSIPYSHHCSYYLLYETYYIKHAYAKSRRCTPILPRAVWMGYIAIYYRDNVWILME